MTDKEKAVVMAHTGTCMLTEDKIHVFYEYIQKIMGRLVYTHELPYIANTIKEKSKDDFIKLCKGGNNNIDIKEIIDYCKKNSDCIDCCYRDTYGCVFGHSPECWNYKEIERLKKLEREE